MLAPCLAGSICSSRRGGAVRAWGACVHSSLPRRYPRALQRRPERPAWGDRTCQTRPLQSGSSSKVFSDTLRASKATRPFPSSYRTTFSTETKMRTNGEQDLGSEDGVSAALGSDASRAGLRVSAALRPTPGWAGLRLCVLRAKGQNRSLPPRPRHPLHSAGISDTLRLAPATTEVEGLRLREPGEDLTDSGTNRPSLGGKLGCLSFYPNLNPNL